MNFKKWRLIGAGVLVLGSLSIAFSYTPQVGVDKMMLNTVKNDKVRPVTSKSHISPLSSQTPTQEVISASSYNPSRTKLPQVASEQPKNLLGLPVKAMQSVLLPPNAKNRQRSVKNQTTLRSQAKKIRPQMAMATPDKPQQLFSYVRLLNFSPHPQQEEFLQKQPIVLNGKKYHISVTYHEGWQMISDEEGNLEKIGFEINIFENGKVVRNLRIPDVAINPATIKPGLILGLAKVEPYDFKISVDSFSLRKKGISELVFKFEMSGS